MARYEFIDRWTIKAPIHQVYQHISDPRTYPQWWPVYSGVEILEQGDANRMGGRARLMVRSALGYTLNLDVETVASNPPHYFKTVSRGNLEGTGEWELVQEGDATRAIWTWIVETHHPLLNRLEWVAKPLFRWSHNDASRKGYQGLKRLLEKVVN